MTESGKLTKARRDFHRALLEREIITHSTLSDDHPSREGFIASNADSGNITSIRIANLVAEQLAIAANRPIQLRKSKKKGQTLGNEFEAICATFLKRTFPHFGNLRPGHWTIEQIGSRSDSILGRYEQYQHLADLAALARNHESLRTILGDSYTIAPDVVVARLPCTDNEINANAVLVDRHSALKASIRASNHSPEHDPRPLIHASISCKFTMRSDRAQNTRTEALNLIRNRKGRAPHIVAVTAGPMPGRIASLAMGTGDLDCVYHFALYELISALKQLDLGDAIDTCEALVAGNRLKDISDLPLDLAV